MNQNDNVGDSMTCTNSCASIDVEIGHLNWSFDHYVPITNNMAVTTCKRKGSPEDGGSGAAMRVRSSVSNTRSAKNGRVNDQEKGGRG